MYQCQHHRPIDHRQRQVQHRRQLRLLTSLSGCSARNRQGRSISMTAPVLTDLDDPQPGLPARKGMAFVLPRIFKSVEQAPEPTDARVRIVTVPARTVAVHRFSGMTTMSDSRRRAEMLASSLKADGHAPLGGRCLWARQNRKPSGDTWQSPRVFLLPSPDAPAEPRPQPPLENCRLHHTSSTP